MSMRFLHIKRAYVVDPLHSFEVDRDLALHISLLDKVYDGKNKHDICAITEEGEWLIHGRKIDPTTVLQLYSIVSVYIHSPSDVYDRAFLICKAYAQKYVLIYKATDAILHHAARLESLIKTNSIYAKMAHQVHVDMTEYNAQYTPSEIVAGKHIRNVFLPVAVTSSLYRTYIPDLHATKLAHTYEDLAAHIDTLRHAHSEITLRAHVVGDTVCVATIPNIRGEKLYTTIPLASKELKGKVHFHTTSFSGPVKNELNTVVQSVSRVLFAKSPVVYVLRVHGKRGVFIEATSPFYFFILHNPDFLFELAEIHGIGVRELFDAVV